MSLLRNFGRHGVCAGLKILRMWFESTRFHQKMVKSVLLRRYNERFEPQRAARAHWSVTTDV